MPSSLHANPRSALRRPYASLIRADSQNERQTDDPSMLGEEELLPLADQFLYTCLSQSGGSNTWSIFYFFDSVGGCKWDRSSIECITRFFRLVAFYLNWYWRTR